MRIIFFASLMLLAASAATAQVTQSQVSTTITSNIPSGAPSILTAASLRAALNQMNTAIFQSQGASGLALSGTPSAGYVPIATGATTAVWGNTITTTGLQSGINTSQTGAGTMSPADFNYNHFFITSDAINAGNNVNFNVTGFRVDMETGGSTVQGSRVALYARNDITSATVNNPQNTYSGLAGVVTAAANAGGTGTGASSSGQLFSMSGGAYVLSGATFYSNLTGMEMGISVASGANLAPRFKFIYNAVPFPTDAQHATALEAAYGISAQTGAIGLNWGILFHDGNGQTPLSAAGTVLGVEGTQTTAHGIDLTGWTFTSDQFKGTGFIVDGSGRVNIGLNSAPVVPLQVHAATNVNLLVANNAGVLALDAINDAINAQQPMQINASTTTFSGGVVVPLPTSAGAGGLNVCVDTAGVFYKKASCP